MEINNKLITKYTKRSLAANIELVWINITTKMSKICGLDSQKMTLEGRSGGVDTLI